MNDIIREFMNTEHIAVIGASANKKKFGRYIYDTLKARGRTVYAVNRGAEPVNGDQAYASLEDLPREVDSAVVAVKPESAAQIIEQAARRGIRRLWFQQGADFSDAIAGAEKQGIATVSNKCILMYLAPVTGIHRVHRFLSRTFGKY